MHKKIIIYLGLSALLTSCAVQIDNVDLKNQSYDEPSLFTFETKEIGKTLFSTGEEDYIEAIKIENLPNFKMGGYDFPYKEGDVLPLTGQTDKWLLYYNKKNIKTSSHNTYNKYNSNVISTTTSEFSGIAISKTNRLIILPFYYDQNWFGGLSTKEIQGLETTNATYVDNNYCNTCYKKEFIFNSKEGNVLKFIYREYAYNMERPMVSQDLQFDLNNSKFIEFKGLVLEVIKVTNTSIEYKILSSFSKQI